jgi:hypothetical protein
MARLDGQNVIIEERRGRFYWHLTGGMLFTLMGKEAAKVKDRLEVLAYLKDHPDEEFDLQAEGLTKELQLPREKLPVCVFVGRVRYDPKTESFVNKPELGV